MVTLPGYQNASLIYESSKSLVYRCIRQADQMNVIYKVLRADYPTLQEQTRYKQEYEILRSLHLEAVIKAYDFLSYQNSVVLVLEDFGGESLKELKRRQAFSIEAFLNLSLKIVESIRQIHYQNIIHKDINPSNIVCNSETGQVKLIDFGISTILNRENPTLKNPDVLEGTLTYMSPEQTGRMNRSLDYRTDFYSLGITLYELLTHKVPFESSDPLELVHCHIAKQPIPPSKVNSQIPQAVSDIIMKLLAKNAEDRYQSAYGIKADLEACLKQVQETGKIACFSLGLQDIHDKFQIPQKLYGRQPYIDTLLAAFEKVNLGQPQMMLVSGYSGIGKSSLVQELYKPLTERRAYFIAGKFDQLQRNIPYSAVVSAFQSLIQQLLTESETQINQWKEKIVEALGSNGKVMTDVIPELELIIGSQPEIQGLGLTESQNRFNLVFQNFIRVFCQQSHPLVIFLDDLQWSDSATLNLMKLMMVDADLDHLFLIGAYRDNEVTSTHPLTIMLDELKKAEFVFQQITLLPLELKDITQLIADTLQANETSVNALASLVQKKTLGNPFFINEFLKYLYQERLISFNADRLTWQWNISQIEATNITDNVVDLMIQKLKKLPPTTQEIISLCACVGNHFDLTLISTICETSETQVFQALLQTLQQGLVLPTSELETVQHQDVNSPLLIFNYKFSHDRVQQAAYALIDEEDKIAIHLKIGRLLQNHFSAEEKNENLFTLVDHLNLGQSLIQDEQERFELATLNLEAGQKAKNATAYGAAKAYLMTCLELLGNQVWIEHYDLALSLYKDLIEVEFLTGNIEKSEALVHCTLEQVKSDLEKAEVYRLLIMQYCLTGKPEQAIEAGRKSLALLGIELPETDFPTVLEAARIQVEEKLKNQNIAQLINRDNIQFAEQQIAAKLLVEVDPAAYFVDGNLYSIIVLKSVNLYLDYGNVPEGGKGYSTYGILRGSLWGDYQSGYEFGLLALNVAEKFNNLSYKCKACFVLANFLNSWVKPIKEAEAINNQGYLAGMESGDIPFAGYTFMFQPIHAFFQGLELKQVLAKLYITFDFFQKYKNQWSYDAVLGLEIAVVNLLGMTNDKFEFQSNQATEKQYLETCNSHKSYAWICQYYIFKMQILLLYDQPQEALICSQEAEKNIANLLGMVALSQHNFYTSLCLLAVYPTVSEAEQEEYRIKLAENQQKMKLWAENCPENFLHQYLLIEAETARILGRTLEAIDLYERAIKAATEHEFIQNEALANELAAKFWLSQGKEKYAKVHLVAAYSGYERWGAKFKLEILEGKYSDLRLKTVINSNLETTYSTQTSSTESGSSQLDFISILKASQAIASDLVLDKLLASLVEISIENAGAQTGMLLLMQDGQLFIEAFSSVESDEVVVRQSIPVQSYNRLPLTIINYVRRTRSDVVVKDAGVDERFVNDPYITANDIKSVLCTPILNQGQLIAILYLENNLTVGAFTSERLQVLKILCSQAAISLENALLYSLMEKKVEERTQELNHKNIRLEETLTELKRTQTQLIQTEKMSSLGQLVAGVAHEINNPVNFIYGNLVHVGESTENLLNLLQLYVKHYPNPVDEIQEELEAVELDFLVEDLPKMLSSMKVGSDRIRQIVLSLRNFSRLDEADMKAVDLHEGLDNTLLILQNRTKAKPDRPAIDVVKKYGNLPKVACYVSQLNQVFMNILVNACDILEDKVKSQMQASKSRPNPAIIEIQTSTLNNGWVSIRIADNGLGMNEDTQKRLFDPFFTTKPIGQGTGLGLAISYQIVVEKHGGKLLCNSELGKGTEFIIEIPIHP